MTSVLLSTLIYSNICIDSDLWSVSQDNLVRWTKQCVMHVRTVVSGTRRKTNTIAQVHTNRR
jgi:hypothetical protein